MNDNDFQFENNIDDFQTHIHIRVEQRRGRKCFTTVEGIPPEFDYEKIMKYWKKWLSCNATIVEEDEGKKVIKLNGDHRNQIQQFLSEEGIAAVDNITIHGI
ncbi:hypothetical protein ABPG74_017737 [Tetrahymena malaccensis]|nr:Chain F, Eif1 [Tetrahymena thermophila]4BPN_F Chain F, Eif1 [Tetrahymena thermophila]4BPO_F Chain F, Eif1 [Tetrahymena thermophila]4BTS_AF Chain AF, EIF1 [Tetrahymena thermophila]4BTS_BF Chain BF, EIF1 [Tetrahymena thermophila]4BTS_CF Chain CF, EIF1 [Tetrahymena thermophila]4BTS_DF Chain DF, EIF1 [Tetrahymena thermophila]4V5O_AF Chain AF, EIF1 [Tetrahymena thermophila]4V5O_BF Chain BF, EIF1 [Tetrahymena thermophila]DAA33997.1 TPA_exp: translation initiation factor eIF1 [Tetrahymena ther